MSNVPNIKLPKSQNDTIGMEALPIVLPSASFPFGCDDSDECVSFTGECRIESSEAPGMYELVFVHKGVERRQVAATAVVHLLLKQSGYDKPTGVHVWIESIHAGALRCLEKLKANQAGVGEALCSSGTICIGGLEIVCEGTMAGQLWAGGAALGHKLLRDGYLPPCCMHCRRPTIVELGSGTGFAGLAAALVAGSCRVVLTDRPAVVRRLQAAIQRNAQLLEAHGAHADAAPLSWGDADAAAACCPDGCDLVLVADCLYQADSSTQTALRESVAALARPRQAVVLHVYAELSELISRRWRAALASGEAGLTLVSETSVEPPPQVEGCKAFAGGRIVLEELRLA